MIFLVGGGRCWQRRRGFYFRILVQVFPAGLDNRSRSIVTISVLSAIADGNDLFSEMTLRRST